MSRREFDAPKSIFSVDANFDDCVGLNRFVDNCVVSATAFIPNTPEQNAEASYYPKIAIIATLLMAPSTHLTKKTCDNIFTKMS